MSIDERKTTERHYYLKPITASRVRGRQLAREIVGWRYEVSDGWGHVLTESPLLYKTQAEALEAAREAEQPTEQT